MGVVKLTYNYFTLNFRRHDFVGRVVAAPGISDILPGEYSGGGGWRGGLE